jgi:hypothetical protein
MIPSLAQTYGSVASVMNVLRKEPTGFGSRILLGGKTKGNGGRETWLSNAIAKDLGSKNFNARAEISDRRNGRIDIAIFDAADHLQAAIEVKYYFCHQWRRASDSHQFIENTQKDFNKRAHLGVPQQAIVFASRYSAMPENGKSLGLYQAEAIYKHLCRDDYATFGFERLERDLVKRFGSTCEIFPLGKGENACEGEQWIASHLGASASIRAWILSLRYEPLDPTSANNRN